MTTAHIRGSYRTQKTTPPIFFGRDRERRAISAALRASRLTVLYGESGAGKSSVLAAGVAHDLREDPEFALVLFRNWHDDPVAGLVNAVRSFLSRPEALGPNLNLNAANDLSTLLEAWAVVDRRCLLIVLDQFEEYFQYHPGDKGFGTLVEELPRLLNRPEAPVNFLISVREDALSALDRFKGAIPGLFDNLLRVEHLTDNAAQDAITQPLERFNQELRAGRLTGGNKLHGIEIDRGLAAEVVTQIVAAQGGEQHGVQASYLQLVMTRWWEREISVGSNRMLATTLQKLGGVKTIVERYLEDTIATLSPEQQRLAAEAFDYMVTPTGRKIAQTVSELSGSASVRSRASPTILQELMEKLQTARLLAPVPPPRGSRADERCYEFAHDVVAKAAFEWRNGFRKAQELGEARKRLRRAIATITALALLSVVLLLLSVSAWRNADRARKTGLQEKAAAVPSLLALRPAEGLLLALETTAESWRRLGAVPETVQANLKDAVESSRERLVIPSPGGPIVALAMSPDGQFLAFNSGDGKIHVWDLGSSDIMEQALPGIPDVGRTGGPQSSIPGPKSVLDPRNPGNPLAISPDGKLILTSGEDGRSVLLIGRDGKNETKFQPAHSGRVVAALFHPDGKRIISASVDAEIRTWDGQGKPTGKPRHLPGGTIYSLHVSADGRLIAFARGERGLLITDWVGNTVCEAAGATVGSVISVAFSPRSGTLAVGTEDGTVSVLDSQCRPAGKTIRGHSASVTSIAFHPDGSRFATGSLDYTIRIWNVRGEPVGPVLRGHEAGVQAVVFHPAGKLLVSASSARPGEMRDNTLRVWNVDGALTVASRDLGQPGLAVAFSHDGSLVATASADYDKKLRVRLWTASGLPMAPPLEYPVNAGPDKSSKSAAIFALSFAQDDSSLVGAGVKDGKVFRFNWDLKSTQHSTELESGVESYPLLNLDPDGSHVYIGGATGSLQVWQTDRTSAPPPVQILQGPIEAMAVSSNGKTVALAGEGPGVKLWSAGKVHSGELLLEDANGVSAVAFSGDGSQVAAGGMGGSIVTWDLQGKPLGHVMRDHTGTVSGLAFRPDGQMIASSSIDRTVRLWTSDGTAIGSPLLGHEDGVQAIAFSPDGSMLASVGADRQLRIWRSNWQSWFRAGCYLLEHHPLLRDSGNRSTDAVREACGQLPIRQSFHQYGWARVLTDDRSDSVALYLRGHRGSLEARDTLGRTPLILAARLGNRHGVAAIQKAGANVSARDQDGDSALHFAARAGNPGTIKTLLDAGAPADLLNGSGETPLHLAAASGSIEAVRLLLAHGATPDKRDSSGRNAVQRAELEGHAAVANLLLEKAPHLLVAANPAGPYTEIAEWRVPKNLSSELQVARAYETGKGHQKSLETAAKYYRSAAEKGDAFGQYAYGRMLYFGGGLQRNLPESFRWLSRAVEQNEAAALTFLGANYHNGDGGFARDVEQAESLYRKAAVLGERGAISNLCIIYVNEQITGHSDQDAVYWCKNGAELGDEYAESWLGWLYLQGRGVPRSYEKAAELFAQAAKKNRDAQFSLGWLYENGLGVDRSDAQAAKWYRSAAEQGLTPAQACLGRMYEEGAGLEKSREQAVFWYRRAAAQGSAEGKASLKRLGEKEKP